MDDKELYDAEDFALPFSEEVSEKIQSVFADNQTREIKAYAANVLIGHIPAKKVNESVGDTFELCGFHTKLFRFKDEHDGRFVTLFGYTAQKNPCSYVTTSDKIYDALIKIVIVYGTPATWNNGIMVKIRMNTLENGKAYSLEVLN